MPTPRFLEGCPSVWAWSVDARLALLLLGLGMALATAPVEAAGGTMMGSGIMVLVAWCSALAGVLNEWLIKKSNNVLEAGRLWLERLRQANVWLYLFGTLAALAPLPWSASAAEF